MAYKEKKKKNPNYFQSSYLYSAILTTVDVLFFFAESFSMNDDNVISSRGLRFSVLCTFSLGFRFFFLFFGFF